MRVKEVAIGKGFTMSSLQRKADISFRTIKRYFQRPYDPVDTGTLAKVAEALEVGIGDLIEMVPEESQIEE